MSVFQAALIALAYAFSQSAFNAGLGGYILSQPLVAGTIVGLLLGDPLSGAALGGVLNLSTLALSNLRLRIGPDIALAGYVGIPIMLLNGFQADDPQALVIFGALAVFSILLVFMRGVFNSVLAHWADYFAERGDTTLVAFINVGPSQVWLFVVTFIPAFLLLRFDLQTMVNITSAVPLWVQSALRLSQYLLAALGIAMSARVLVQGSSAAYFFLGWLAAHALGPVPVTLLGASIATIHAFVARKRMEPSQDTLVADALPSDQVDLVATPGRSPLTPSDLRVSLILWVFFHNAALNFERFQNIGFAAALAPIARKLYANAEERAACLRRHLALFGTEFSLGALAVGASVALEERRALGDAISEAEFVGAKTGVMAALGVTGDALVQGAVTAFAIAVGASLAQQHNLLGPFLFIVFEATVILSIAYASYRAGYLYVRRAAAWARVNDWLRAGLFGAVRLGAFVLGAWLLTFVPLQLPASAVIQIDSAQIALQSGVLDRIMPNMLSLVLVLVLWWLLRRRNTGPMVLLGALIVLAFVACGALSLVGWL